MIITKIENMMMRLDLAKADVYKCETSCYLLIREFPDELDLKDAEQCLDDAEVYIDGAIGKLKTILGKLEKKAIAAAEGE